MSFDEALAERLRALLRGVDSWSRFRPSSWVSCRRILQRNDSGVAQGSMHSDVLQNLSLQANAFANLILV